MKALTVCQPWAWAIAEGLKRVENRTWPTSHRGWLLIHAGRSRDWFTPETVAALAEASGRASIPSASSMHYGAFVAVARLARCDRLMDSPERDHRFAEGPWCWLFEDVSRCSWPVPCRGAQGLWEVPPGIVARVLLAAEVRRG